MSDKIVVVQNLDKPGCYGSFWGEVNANTKVAIIAGQINVFFSAKLKCV